MITSKVFVKKTKKGSVVKTVREHYLRDDILCGSAICSECPEASTNLEAFPPSCSDLCTNPHYIIPDSNVVIHQIDVLGETAFKNVIILQTVLEELRHRHSPAYNRLREIISNADRHFYTFTNEHHRHTYTERKPGESANDRNDRAIRNAAKWYQEHLKLSGASNLKVVLLTNDKENSKKAEEEGLTVFTFAEYVKSMAEFPSLVDKLANTDMKKNDGHEFVQNKGKYLYPEHWKLSKIQDSLKAGTLSQGKFQASRENYLEGYVFIGGEDESNSKSIFIQGLKNLNRVVHGDNVAVQILPQDQWTCPSSLVLEDKAKNPDEEKDDNDEKVVKKKASTKIMSGTIVGIIKRNWRPYCGMLQAPSIKGQTSHYLFVPTERRIPKIRIQTRQGEKLLSQRIIVSIDSWPRDSRYPQGHFVQSLGDVGEKETENQVLLLEHDIPHQPFSKAVLDCLPELPWIITDKDLAVRRDLRDIAICSVDPPGCTDIDDALHCRKLENGNLEVGVHIADVSHFIRPGTAIDAEAAVRGTTVYLVDKRIDMVPELLSSNLCSLRGNEERFAFSVIWEMTAEAKILRSSFFKSIIKSKAALTYAEAQMRIDDKSLNDDITVSLRLLNSLAKILKKQRIENGALSLASTEVRFAMDTETHDPIDVEKKELKETNSMVEEFMLLANISVAKRIHEEFPECALLRRHPSPALSNFEPLLKAGISKGFSIQVDSGKALANSLDDAVVPENPYFNIMLRMVATRCMAQALYFSSGVLPYSDYFHYGLAVPIYTHFTSPIRRYSDVIVHRLLAVAIGADVTYPSLVDKNKTQELCNNLNYRHKQAQYCGRASVNLYTHIFFKDKTVEEEGYILFIRENALQILLPRFGLECTLYLNSPNKDDDELIFTYDQEGPSQSAAGVTLRQFDPVTIQLHIDKTNVQHQKTALRLVKPFIPGFSVGSINEEPPTKKHKTM
ncbi:exosome complex exonuclease RRP44 [Trichonephila inaurata madagascariensis]|uniref:Protein DIS3 homolog n=1 Tax=Trichonephila inaurata madagascariensis TaxID=2747483 RepID=A0A8X7CJJ9_9ARAC|nr:exosome complex exonuclease RRP44 [Trichonephila inaurata madagascariensis]